MPPAENPNPALPPIHLVRGQRVMLDRDLARLYAVPTKVFNQAMQRNAERFPADFLFRLTDEEASTLKSHGVTSTPDTPPSLRSQIVTLKNAGRGQHRKYLPWVFTEHGAIMAATILRSPRAVAMSVYVVRAFVHMREELLTNAVILKRLAQHDKKLLEHDVVLQDVVEKLLPLLNPSSEPRRSKIGFHPGNR
ncbi:ORF6N domain-containing protein [Horticoccus sp. 23ND18S-11]|uniref:ORF6N domain-containing protein n=1 Tax=Horticoccus sp. 23ND18S-11 TaxID=3391832 RepID=UPI0039C919E5